uniref:Uncharacterized protein n=1 Tax=Janibacter limosus TaxID=53458 RepID=A0AC61U897_9MICO|nr:hypothetical protein [Janibacter limosus]
MSRVARRRGPPLQLLHRPVEDGHEELLLAGVVVVQTGDRQTCTLRDPAHRRPVVADLEETREGSPQCRVELRGFVVVPVAVARRARPGGRGAPALVSDRLRDADEKPIGPHTQSVGEDHDPLRRDADAAVLDRADGADADADLVGQLPDRQATLSPQLAHGPPERPAVQRGLRALLHLPLPSARDGVHGVQIR